MSATLIQKCPVCGRPLRIAAAHAGCHVTCSHCHGRLTANGKDAPEDSLLRRANELLALYAQRFGFRGSSSIGAICSPDELWWQRTPTGPWRPCSRPVSWDARLFPRRPLRYSAGC
jgi:hypothetical protein